MLYKFKSPAAADVIMLEADGRRILELIGKGAGSPGIVTAAQIPGAIAALEAAVSAEDAAAADAEEREEEEGSGSLKRDAVRLRQRATPFIDLLRRSAAEGADVVWGV
ncbi:DUF1840 domain-containing protein [Xylophilus sp.]|uniref:DUF1840 domain-containing protein n=1 Tax=Xylophilus sp. TaxID=2653893 RepID=UPI0013B9925D|nr:DUF1840 domain-containing protein [Xylophilus sp.]KAF1046601.1 MAG: hypothetical protein GAK38_02336 [Xylophilus sp.]